MSSYFARVCILLIGIAWGNWSLTRPYLGATSCLFVYKMSSITRILELVEVHKKQRNVWPVEIGDYLSDGFPNLPSSFFPSGGYKIWWFTRFSSILSRVPYIAWVCIYLPLFIDRGSDHWIDIFYSAENLKTTVELWFK
jgi:hypothetical protein